MGRLSLLDTMNVKEHQNSRFNAYLFLIAWASRKFSLYHENSEENVKLQALKEKEKRCQLQQLSHRWYSENHSFLVAMLIFDLEIFCLWNITKALLPIQMYPRSIVGALDITCLRKNTASISSDTPLHLFCALDMFPLHGKAQALCLFST